jgi:peptidoglycan hydrolase-like amidase
MKDRREPKIAVGLIDGAKSIRLSLHGGYERADATGACTPMDDGEHELTAASGELHLVPRSPAESFFRIETTIGIDFHWQQRELQSFHGGLRVEVDGERGLVAINDVPLETYLTSVICSEMNAASPPDLLRAHAIISRSWLLAQIGPPPDGFGSLSAREGRASHDEGPVKPVRSTPEAAAGPGEQIKWYDREAHRRFDVCADDHCQRYQGITRIATSIVADALRSTRGMVLLHRGRVADARYAKCCGGVTEAYRAAWHDEDVPYLVPIFDGPDPRLPARSLTEEEAARAFIETPPAGAFCRCDDTKILDAILPRYDRNTLDFFRWTVRLGAEEATELVDKKIGVNVGRIIMLEGVERGPSGRLIKLRIRGERGSIVIGKELEIRRALSKTHLYSSAFVVDVEGPPERPEAFVLRGAGWGHGVGLCQIGAAVMGTRGYSHQQILAHYYPNTTLGSIYD